MLLSRRAQSLMEYVLLITILVAAVMTMFPRLKRTTQSMMKSAADQIGDQKGAEQDMNTGDAYLQGSNTVTSSQIDNVRNDAGGWSVRNVQEQVTTMTNSLTNMGFILD